jgi:hypothetical protein
MAGARQGQPARVRAPQRGASARLGLPRQVFASAVAGGGTSVDMDRTCEQCSSFVLIQCPWSARLPPCPLHPLPCRGLKLPARYIARVACDLPDRHRPAAKSGVAFHIAGLACLGVPPAKPGTTRASASHHVSTDPSWPLPGCRPCATRPVRRPGAPAHLPHRAGALGQAVQGHGCGRQRVLVDQGHVARRGTVDRARARIDEARHATSCRRHQCSHRAVDVHRNDALRIGFLASGRRPMTGLSRRSG